MSGLLNLPKTAAILTQEYSEYAKTQMEEIADFPLYEQENILEFEEQHYLLHPSGAPIALVAAEPPSKTMMQGLFANEYLSRHFADGPKEHTLLLGPTNEYARDNRTVTKISQLNDVVFQASKSVARIDVMGSAIEIDSTEKLNREQLDAEIRAVLLGATAFTGMDRTIYTWLNISPRASLSTLAQIGSEVLRSTGKALSVAEHLKELVDEGFIPPEHLTLGRNTALVTDSVLSKTLIGSFDPVELSLYASKNHIEFLKDHPESLGGRIAGC